MLIIADPDRGFQARVAEQLGRRGELVQIDKLQELERVLPEHGGSAGVILLGPNLPTAGALEVAGRLQLSHQEVSVVVVVNALTSDLLQSALRAGVRDVLPAQFTPQQLVDTVDRAEALTRQFRERQAGPAEPDKRDENHKVVTVFSSKGGVGKSFVSSNIAVLLAQRLKQDVALVDLDLQFGDLAIMLQLFPARTMYDAAQNLARLDADALRGYLTPYRGSVHLLAAPLEPGLAETISAEAASTIIRMLRHLFRYVVIDTPPSFTDHVLAALDESDDAILLTTMDVPSIKNLKLSLQTLEMLGIGRERIRLVLNRADSKVGLRINEVEKTLRTRVDVALPSSRDVPLSINRGSPLVTDDPKSPVAQALVKLAESIAGPETPAALPQAAAGRHRFGRR
jgi:pilus assembly protein CpaE